MLSREWRPFDAMRTEVMAGQYLDTLEQAQGTATREAALRYKPAKYTVERPLGLGATLVGGGSSSMALSTSRAVRAPVRIWAKASSGASLQATPMSLGLTESRRVVI